MAQGYDYKGRREFSRTKEFELYEEHLGPELVINGDMSSGDPPDDWAAGGDNPVLSRVEANGGYAMDVLIADGQVGGGVIQTDFPLVIGKTYRLSARLRNVNLTGAGIRILVFDNAWNIVSSGDWITDTDFAISTFDFTLATAAGHVYFQVAGTAGQHGQATDISLREVINP